MGLNLIILKMRYEENGKLADHINLVLLSKAMLEVTH